MVTSTNPVHRGDILTIYLTGLGAVNPPVNDGSAGLVDPLSTTVITPTVQIGGQMLRCCFQAWFRVCRERTC